MSDIPYDLRRTWMFKKTSCRYQSKKKYGLCIGCSDELNMCSTFFKFEKDAKNYVINKYIKP